MHPFIVIVGMLTFTTFPSSLHAKATKVVCPVPIQPILDASRKGFILKNGNYNLCTHLIIMEEYTVGMRASIWRGNCLNLKIKLFLLRITRILSRSIGRKSTEQPVSSKPKGKLTTFESMQMKLNPIRLSR